MSQAAGRCGGPMPGFGERVVVGHSRDRRVAAVGSAGIAMFGSQWGQEGQGGAEAWRASYLWRFYGRWWGSLCGKQHLGGMNAKTTRVGTLNLASVRGVNHSGGRARS
eukprot:GFKZ01008187.1.p5 GENE.GFKZ01008187.1~~GFKZ01008187.1.p5  ORF type:complete len:108 (-),score=0.88 GFKZ01008187.1:1184-1507(-)